MHITKSDRQHPAVAVKVYHFLLSVAACRSTPSLLQDTLQRMSGQRSPSAVEEGIFCLILNLSKLANMVLVHWLSQYGDHKKHYYIYRKTYQAGMNTPELR